MQTEQAEPLIPHPLKPGTALHSVPSQQPAAQLVELHWVPLHTPELQLAVPQAGVVPHRQLPAAEQPSAFVDPQAMHVAPPTPQLASADILHIPPAQQPLGQLWALQLLAMQAPALHVCPAAHGGPMPHLHPPAVQVSDAKTSHVTHAPPPEPQLSSAEVLHTEPEQHPVPQVVPSQTQPPETQRVPRPHAGPVPHLQAPPAHASALNVLQAAQAVPGAAQLVSDWPVQVVPAQQPVAHEVASQTHAPATQR